MQNLWNTIKTPNLWIMGLEEEVQPGYWIYRTKSTYWKLQERSNKYQTQQKNRFLNRDSKSKEGMECYILNPERK
jgi:hypothetical protein